MDNNRVTVRYAKALFELSNEREILDQVNGDIRQLFTTLDQLTGFEHFILNPAHSTKKKFESIHTTFGADFHELTLKFIRLVLSKNREEYLKDICRNFLEFARVKNNIISAKLKTATELDVSLITKIKDTFENKTNSTIELTSEINPELLGGFIFIIEGQQYDASVATSLKTIKKQLQLK